jgi:hypothetical protein
MLTVKRHSGAMRSIVDRRFASSGMTKAVIASEAKQSIVPLALAWIASSLCSLQVTKLPQPSNLSGKIK